MQKLAHKNSPQCRKWPQFLLPTPFLEKYVLKCLLCCIVCTIHYENTLNWNMNISMGILYVYILYTPHCKTQSNSKNIRFCVISSRMFIPPASMTPLVKSNAQAPVLFCPGVWPRVIARIWLAACFMEFLNCCSCRQTYRAVKTVARKIAWLVRNDDTTPIFWILTHRHVFP